MKNDKLFIMEGNVNNERVANLMREFKEDLKPVGIACKSWAKATNE